MHPVVIVSNRGPLAYHATAAGELKASRGAGGLAGGLGGLVSAGEIHWIASALSEGDRAAARSSPLRADGCRLSLIAHEPSVLHHAYDVIGNEMLWSLHHGLFDLAYEPRIDAGFRAAWEGYRAFNSAFADAIVNTAPAGAAVLVQDYHVALVAGAVQAARPDVALVHFSHTPFAGPQLLSLLPDPYRTELLAGMASFHSCGFHTVRWRDRFLASCRAFGVEPPATFVSPLAADPASLHAAAAGDACNVWQAEIDRLVGDRQVIARVDRMEPSKNVLRGFWAFDELLERWPRWRGAVTFVAAVYPSREQLARYSAYRDAIHDVVEEVNRRWATPGWTPIVLYTDDDFPRSVAVLQRYDALVVNPVADGMNLVAKEGPLVNTRDGALVLSTEAGAWDELHDGAFTVHPCDVSATADALHAALSASPADRHARAATLRHLAAARTPKDWLDDQFAATNR